VPGEARKDDCVVAGDKGSRIWVDRSVNGESMVPGKARAKDISEYIDAAPKEAQKKLREMHKCIRKAALGAKEGLKWGMPAFSYQRILVMFPVSNNTLASIPRRRLWKRLQKS
jgi:hypothetical protein